MYLWRLALVVAVAVLALPYGELAGAEVSPPPAALPQTPAGAPAAAPVPAAPAATPAAPAAPPAPSGAGPAAGGKEAPVVLSMPPAMPNVFGGRIEFAEKAFPILAEHKAAAAESAINSVKSLPCQACRGSGKVAKRELVKATPPVRGLPILHAWEEDCPACGGYKDVFDVRVAPRLLDVVDRLGHVARDEKFDGLRQAAAERLAIATEVRDKMLPTFRCEPVLEKTIRTKLYVSGHTDENTYETMIAVKTVPGPTRPFHQEMAPLIEPLWARLGFQAPVGQAVLIIGTTSDRTEAGGWVWMRMKPSGKGPDAILLCGAPPQSVVPDGKIVFGGLMVGRWIPESMATPPAPAAGAKGPPPPTAGMLPQGMLPVVLAVVAKEGK